MTELDDRLDPQQSGRHAGDVIILANAIGTFAFAITAVTAAIVFTTAAQWVGAITAMSLFTVGVFAFLWSFWNVVQRSREELVGVTQVYLLVGPPTPGRVRVRMLGLLAVQIVVALVTALSRTETADGRAGSSLALGVLVPMFGLGLNTLGENILVGPNGMSSSAMETTWMNSSGHRVNILNGSFTVAGVGVAVSADGRIWVAVDFGG